MAGNLRARLALIRERAVNQSSANHSGKPAPSANGSGRRDEFPAGWASTGEGVRFKETIAAFGMTAPGAPMRLAAFSPRFGSSQTAWKDVIFFDLETTGLSGGSGTVAFLAALGRWRADGTFSVRQYFIDDYPAEPLFLACLESEFASAKAVVTYKIGRAHV